MHANVATGSSIRGHQLRKVKAVSVGFLVMRQKHFHSTVYAVLNTP